MNNKIKGGKGEAAAEKFLTKKGYKTLAKNFTAANGEIDLICRLGKTVVFVEVKSRNSLTYGQPCEAVTMPKQRHILATATAYLQQNKITGSAVRFDVVEVFEDKINHIENAFGAN